jgi:hypothetical protein
MRTINDSPPLDSVQKPFTKKAAVWKLSHSANDLLLLVRSQFG